MPRLALAGLHRVLSAPLMTLYVPRHPYTTRCLQYRTLSP